MKTTVTGNADILKIRNALKKNGNNLQQRQQSHNDYHSKITNIRKNDNNLT